MKDYVFSHDIRKQTPFLSRAALQVGRDTHMPMNYTSSVFSNKHAWEVLQRANLGQISYLMT